VLFVLKTSSKCKWYCLLPESIGRHKRMALNVEMSSVQSKKSSTMKKPPSNGLVLNVSAEIKRKDIGEFEHFRWRFMIEMKFNFHQDFRVQ